MASTTALMSPQRGGGADFQSKVRDTFSSTGLSFILCAFCANIVCDSGLLLLRRAPSRIALRVTGACRVTCGRVQLG